jgi:hypothetical protein
VVVIYEESGSALCSRRLSLIQLRRNTVDITPGTRRRPLTALTDLDGDGVAEALLLDATLGDDCSLWDGAVPIVMRRSGGEFVYAFSDFQAQYAFWRDWFRDNGVFPDFVELRDLYVGTREALILAQAGHVDAGRSRLRAAIAQMPQAIEDDVDQWHPWLVRYYGLVDPDIPLVELLDNARATPTGGCPASEAGMAAESESSIPVGH